MIWMMPPRLRCGSRAWRAALFFGMLPTARTAHAQDVLIEGTLRCSEGPSRVEYRLARNTLVEPRGYPRSAVLTTDFGYYPLRLRRSDVIDRTITILYQGKDSVDLQRLFVAEERLGSSNNLRLAVLNSDVSCDRLEFNPQEAQRRLDSVRAMGQKGMLTRLGLASAGLTAAGATALLTVLLGVAGDAYALPTGACFYLGPDGTIVPCIPDSTKVTTVVVVPAGGGETRGLASLALGPVSQNGGFGFSPSREWSGTEVFGTAAVTGAGTGRASLQTDYDRFVRLSALLPLGNRAGIAASYFGFHETRFIERLTADNSPVGATVGRSLRLVSLGGALETSAKISLGISANHIHHVIDAATAVERTTDFWPSACLSCPPVTVANRLLVNEVTTDRVDFDLSALLRRVGDFQFGLTVLSVLGTRLTNHDGTTTSLRAIGGGTTYRRGRLNLGLDALFSAADDPNLVLGVNYVPLNETLLQASLSTELRSWQVGAQFRNVRYTFVRDPQWGSSHLTGLSVRF